MNRVNRIALDGSTVTASIGRHEIRLEKASYGDKLEIGTFTGMGSQQIEARTPGSYKVDDLKLSVEAIEFRTKLYPLLQQDGFGGEGVSVTISFSHPDAGDDSDMCAFCRITSTALSIANDNKAQVVEVTLNPIQIYWGSERKTINRCQAPAVVASKF